MRARLLSLLWLPCFLFVSIFLTLPAFAGNWGQNWGEMTWGEVIAAVPLTGKVGFLFLVFGLLGVVLWTFRSRVATGAVLLALIVGGANFAEAQTVSVPNTLTTGSVADADAMNDNFAELEFGLNAALTTGSVAVPNIFTNGTTADADEVNANFTALETGVNIALDNRAADCAGAGGTWDAGTSTCTPAADPYNCLFGGFCSQAAIDFPPADYGYTNVYDGHTQTTEPALGAGCGFGPTGSRWTQGTVQWGVVNSIPGFPYTLNYLIILCASN